MSIIINKDLGKDKIEENNKITNNNNHYYSFINNNNENIITMKIINNLLKLNVCIKELNGPNNNINNINYYSKIFELNELIKINEIFKYCKEIKDVVKILDKIFLNNPLIIIEENKIKIYMKETIVYSFNFDLPKTEKTIFEQETEETSKILYNNNNNNNINNNNKDFIIVKNINLNINSYKDNNCTFNENIKLKNRILILEENQKKTRDLLEELKKDKENKIKLIEEKLNKIKEKINKEETNSLSHLFFDEKLKFGLKGKTEPIKLFNNNINKEQEKNNNNPMNIIPILNKNNLFLEKNNEDIKKSNNNNKKENENNNGSGGTNGFFKNIHNNLKNNLKKEKDINNDINNKKEKVSEEDDNYLYSNSENEIIDDIQFFDKHNSKQKIIENVITPIENDNKRLIGNKRRNNRRKDINLSFSKKSEDYSSEEIILDSKIVSFFEDYEFLINYLRNDLNLDVIKAIKIYRASENGDQANIFHSLCDNNTNVILLIKTKDRKKFGGFTSKGFNSNNIDIIDNSAFVFSIDKKRIYQVKQNEKAISCYSSNGPSFTKILTIPDRFFSNMCYTFVKDLNYLTYEDYEINNGNKYFKIEELEVLELLVHD